MKSPKLILPSVNSITHTGDSNTHTGDCTTHAGDSTPLRAPENSPTKIHQLLSSPSPSITPSNNSFQYPLLLTAALTSFKETIDCLKMQYKSIQMQQQQQQQQQHQQLQQQQEYFQEFMNYQKTMMVNLQQQVQEQQLQKKQNPTPTIVYEEIDFPATTNKESKNKKKSKTKKNQKQKEQQQHLIEQAKQMQKQCEAHLPHALEKPTKSSTTNHNMPPSPSIPSISTAESTEVSNPAETLTPAETAIPVSSTSSGNATPEAKPKTIQSMVLGSSIVKHMRGGTIKRSSGKYCKVCSYPGAGSEKITDHAEVELKYASPKSVIIYAGGNDIANKLSINDTVENIAYLAQELKHRGVQHIAISSIVPRIDLKKDIPKLNEAIKKLCRIEGYHFINNHNIYYYWHLAKDKIHLNYEGVEILEENFASYLRNLKLDEE